MNYLLDFISNKFFITAVLSWTVAQVLKVFIYAIINKTWDISRLFGDGGIDENFKHLCHSPGKNSGYKKFVGNKIKKIIH